MDINSKDLAIDTIEEDMSSYSLLNPTWGNLKSRRAWMQRVLDRLSCLTLGELEEFAQDFKRVLEEVERREQHEVSSYAKVEYKQISGSYYAYLREWGSKQSYKSIGNAYFLPFRKYKLVSKATQEVKILASLGLWRLEESKLYLIIQQAYPKQVLEKYLFCDFSLKYPADPKAPQVFIKKLFARKYWDCQCLGEVDNFAELGINDYHASFVTSLEIPLPELKIELPSLQRERTASVSKSEQIRLQALSQPVSLNVSLNSRSNIANNFRTWQLLSRESTVPQLYRLKTFWQKGKNTIVLADMSNTQLAQLDDDRGCLSAADPQLLCQSLARIAASLNLRDIIDLKQQKKIKKVLNIEKHLKNLSAEQLLHKLFVE